MSLLPTAPAAARERATRDDALHLARRLFLACERVDLSRMSLELGVGRTTLYRWFGDRARLLGEVLGDLNELAWRTARGPEPPRSLEEFQAAMHRFAELTSANEPARHFARTEPGMALRVLLDPGGRIRREMVDRVTEGLVEHTAPGYGPDTADLLVEVAVALVWTPITIGREPDLGRMERLLAVLTPPPRAEPG